MEAKYPALRAKARKHGATISFLDESGFDSEPRLGWTYGLKGQTPVVPTTGQRQKINAVSAVTASGAFWCQLYSERLTGKRFVQFLREFIRGRSGRVILIVDGHPAHKAQVVKDIIQELEGKTGTIVPAALCARPQPRGVVWGYMKTSGLSTKPLRQS